MSLTGSATDTNLNVLRGKIVSVSPYSIDPSLKTEGAAADAKATGDAIDALENQSNSHINSVSNPHKVTKAQVGLGDVDNTADIEKPVSRPQAEAIADAKKAGTDAKAALDLALSERNEFTDEEKEKLAGIEEGANKYVLESGAVTYSKILDGAVGTTKIADTAVTRAKLAQDALYSPVKFSGSRNLTPDDIGVKIATSWSAATTYTMTADNSNLFPIGATIAIIRWGSADVDVKIAFDSKVRAAISGEASLQTAKSFKIANPNDTIALQKMSNDTTNGDAWLIIGDVEVVS